MAIPILANPSIFSTEFLEEHRQTLYELIHWGTKLSNVFTQHFRVEDYLDNEEDAKTLSAIEILPYLVKNLKEGRELALIWQSTVKPLHQAFEARLKR